MELIEGSECTIIEGFECLRYLGREYESDAPVLRFVKSPCIKLDKDGTCGMSHMLPCNGKKVIIIIEKDKEKG